MRPVIRFVSVLICLPLASLALSGCVLQRGSVEHQMATYIGMEEGQDFVIEGEFQRSYLGMERVGFGTVVDGSYERYLLSSDDEFERDGLELRLSKRFSDRWQIQAAYSYAEGDGRAEASVEGGGSTDQALTYATPQAISGYSTSTGLFLGNSYGLDGVIDSSNAWSRLSFGAVRTHEVDDQSVIRFGVGGYFEDIQTEHQADVYGTYMGSPWGGIRQASYVKLSDRYVGLQFDLSYDRVFGTPTPTYAGVSGFLAFANREGRGDLQQGNFCGVCGSGNTFEQRLYVDEDDFATTYGLRANAGIVLGEKLDLRLSYEWSQLGDVTQVRTPANPSEQPATFFNDDAERHFFGIGARLRY